MTMPGFSAEASCCRMSAPYQEPNTGEYVDGREVIIPQLPRGVVIPYCRHERRIQQVWHRIHCVFDDYVCGVAGNERIISSTLIGCQG